MKNIDTDLSVMYDIMNVFSLYMNRYRKPKRIYCARCNFNYLEETNVISLVDSIGLMFLSIFAPRWLLKSFVRTSIEKIGWYFDPTEQGVCCSYCNYMTGGPKGRNRRNVSLFI